MAVIGIVGGPQANAAASGNKIYRYNAVSTAADVVAPANPSRRKLTFHNPGTQDIFVAPTRSIAGVSTSTPTSFTPTTAALGGCWRIFANGGTLTLEGEIQSGWQAFAASGADNPLTVMDSNI